MYESRFDLLADSSFEIDGDDKGVRVWRMWSDWQASHISLRQFEQK